MANLYSAQVKAMRENTDIEKRYKQIVDTLETAYRCLEDLMDDPIFLDTIHGEQELAMDQTLELIDGIKYSFIPEYLLPQYQDRDGFDPADVS